MNTTFKKLAGGALLILSTGAHAQTHIGDVTIDGSLCTGFDCAATESFGFDTLRLKENNLRIHFDDTSASASFPANDWRIIINDSSNGGANYFAVEDSTAGRQVFKVSAGAPASALTVDAQGDVGIGTSAAVVELHVVDGDSPTLRLEQNGSSGFTAQTWDIAGNESNFFIRDVTNGSRLSFRIRPGAPESSIDIAADGDVGLGTSSPDRDLDIEGNGPAIRLTKTGGFASTWDILNNPDTGRLSFSDDPDGLRVPFKFGLGADSGLLKVGIVDSSTVSVGGDLLVSANGPAISLTHTGANSSTWDILNNPATGRLSFSDDPTGLRVPFKFGKNANSGLLKIGIVNSSTVSVGGNLAVAGNITATGTITPDYVFKQDYPLLSIDEHASAMWSNSHLPKVAAAQENEDGKGLINLGQRSQGVLEELEIAHIYIEQLHQRLTALESEQEELRNSVNLLLQKNSTENLYTSLD